MRNHAQEALEVIDNTLASSYEGIGATALKAALDAERKAYWSALDEDIKLGFITPIERIDIYLRHGWDYPC